MADENKTLENIKTVLGLEDGAQDAVLDILIRNVSNHLKGRLKKVNKTITDVPEELNYIIEEIVIRRYNRIGSEGYKSDDVEGHKVTFYDLKDEFVPYQEIIDGYKEDDKSEPRRGRVMFI